MKVKKRIISVILTISMLIISVVPALAADISVSPNSIDDNDQSSITVIMPDGDKETYDVFFTDNSVITIHDKGNSTTRLETFFDSGKSVETVYQNKVEILRKTYPSLLVKQSIKENNDYNVEPSNFVFPEKYQSIGSVSFKTNSEFHAVYRQGRSYANKYLGMYVLDTDRKGARIGISDSKKVGNSVVSHRYARLVRESFRLNEDMLEDG